MTHNPVTLPPRHPSSSSLAFQRLFYANAFLAYSLNSRGNWHPPLAATLSIAHQFAWAIATPSKGKSRARQLSPHSCNCKSNFIIPCHPTPPQHFQAARAQAPSVTPALLRTRGEELTLSAAVWWERCAHTGWLTRWETKIFFIGMLSAVMVVWLEASGCIDSWSGLINEGLSQ